MNRLQHISVTIVAVCTPQRNLVNDMKRGVYITPKRGKGRPIPLKNSPMLFIDGSPGNQRKKTTMNKKRPVSIDDISLTFTLGFDDENDAEEFVEFFTTTGNVTSKFRGISRDEKNVFIELPKSCLDSSSVSSVLSSGRYLIMGMIDDFRKRLD